MGKKLKTLSKSLEEAAYSESDLYDENDGQYGEDEAVYDNAVNLPAHRTKHLAQLRYTFPSIGTSFEIAQSNNSHSTGSSLWLSSQVLSSYLLHTCQKTVGTSGKSRKAIELGSGTGLLSLLLATLGWQVLATDLESLIDTVLGPNVENGMAQLQSNKSSPAGSLLLHELDWQIEPANWSWNQTGPFTGTYGPSTSLSQQSLPDFDLIVTADTIYESTLIRPLFRTIAYLYSHFSGKGSPTVLLALERRDSTHIDSALRIAQIDFGLHFCRIPPRQVRKIFDHLGDGKSWTRQDWDGVEIWKL